MGYSLSWAAIKNGDPKAMHAVLGLQATGTWEEVAESDVCGVELPTGWYLVLFNRKEMNDNVLRSLSSLGELVYCFVEDHVMFSCAAGWNHKNILWSVTHDCEKGRYHLDVSGDTPASLDGIRAKLIAQQDAAGGTEADVDFIYEVPAELAKAVTGFRHDRDMPGMKDRPFEILKKKGFFGRLLGMKN